MKTPTVFGFYGESDTGKTSLIEKIINRLTDDGYKLATVKITDKKIGIDTKGKDTWRHSQAGSKLVVLSSPVETDFMLKENKDIDEILQHINQVEGYDVVLVEGAHDPSIPKIRIGDIPERDNTIFSYKGDFDGVIAIIKSEVAKNKDHVEEEVSVRVNGKPVILTEFPSQFIKKTITGMLRSLKGVDEIKDVEIRFKI